MAEPLSVYLDQNALSALARDPQWTASALGSTLLSEKVHVFVSPVHVLESIQATDPSVRVAIAKVMLALSGGRRMCPSYEFVVADYFFRALEEASPTAITTRDHLDYHRDSSSRIYLGMLALLAHGIEAGPSSVEEVRKTKAINQVLHARAASAPKEWLEALLECTARVLVTQGDPLAPLDALTIEELRGAVAQAGNDPAGVEADVRRKLQKHRGAIAAAYGAIEIGACLDAALPLVGEVDAAFSANGLALALQKWGVSQKVPSAGEPALQVKAMLQRAIYATVKRGLLPATISNEVVLREIENAASAKETPNAGVVFDADHAVYLLHMNIYVTDDEGLLAALRPIAGRLSTPARPVEVCMSAQVQKLVTKLAPK
jgi:hypothetical protein